METDIALHRRILDELAWDPRVKHEEIGVAAKDGVVTLSGFVTSNAARAAAVRAARRVVGVKAVANEVKVRLEKHHERSDTEIAHSAVNALKWAAEVPDERIQVRVEHGWIVLEGEVDWHFQRMAAEHAVIGLTGVKGVNNLVAVAAKVQAEDVRQRIQDALKRLAGEDADRISVEVDGDRVTLRGQARSWAERDEAENAAWNAGVIAVDNQINVGEPALSWP